MSPSTFREDFPEFNDTVKYPDSTVNFFIILGQKMLNADRWGDVLDYGIGLVVAHHLTIAARDQETAELGGTPGKVVGIETSKSVDKVSITFDAGGIAYDNAGFWNMTSYGIRFYQMLRITGAGGIQL